MRQPHASLNLSSRHRKSVKIERLLGLGQRSGPLRLLEIGTGSGAIAHHFASHPSLLCDVFAVDVVDKRVLRDGFDFQTVSDTALPFPAASFDVVITNHVIEHVGDRDAQLHHLTELRRVLKPDGVGYLAVPNRWMLVEPHYKLPFLSWLPRTWRTPFLRLSGLGTHYDCKPLALAELRSLLNDAGLRYEHMECEALAAMQAVERRSLVMRIAQLLPAALWRPLRPIIPTFICKVSR